MAMNTTLAKATHDEVIPARGVVMSALEFSDEQLAMIRDTYANGASPAEFAVLIEISKQRKLNPLLRQIHYVSRWDSQKKRNVWAVQVSIDGLRAIAERTGLYHGQDKPAFVHADDGKLLYAEVAVWRRDWPRPAVGIAYWDEYVQTRADRDTGKTIVTAMWAKMPHVMLAKVAEALALRKAFPEDMGGLYTHDEMGQADNGRHDAEQERDPYSPHAASEPGDAGRAQALLDKAGFANATTRASIATAFIDAVRGLAGNDAAVQEQVWKLVQKRAKGLKVGDASELRAEINAQREAAKRGLPAPMAIAEPLDAPVCSPEFAKFTADLEQIELPGEAVSVWIKHRPDLHFLAPCDKDAAWVALCRKTTEVGKIHNPSSWLRKSITEEELRRGKPEPIGAPDDRVSNEPGAPTAADVAWNAYTDALAELSAPTAADVAAVYLKYEPEIVKHFGNVTAAQKEAGKYAAASKITATQLRDAVAAERAKTDPPKDDGPKGGKRAVRNAKPENVTATAAPVASNDGPQSRVVIDDPQTMASAYLADFARGVDLHAWDTHIDSKRHWHAMLSSLVKRAAVFDGEGLLPDRTRAVVDAIARSLRTTPELARAEMRRRVSEKNSSEVQALLLPVLGGYVRRAA